MQTMLYTTTNSYDEDSNNSIELYSIGDRYYIEQNKKNLFKVIQGQMIIQKKDDISEEELLKIFPNINLDQNTPDFVPNRLFPYFITFINICQFANSFISVGSIKFQIRFKIHHHF